MTEIMANVPILVMTCPECSTIYGLSRMAYDNCYNRGTSFRCTNPGCGWGAQVLEVGPAADKRERNKRERAETERLEKLARAAKREERLKAKASKLNGAP